MKTALFMFLLFASNALAQNKPPRDWMPATVAEVTYSDEEKVVPHSHMVKRQGCQGGIGCYDKVVDEPLHVPLNVNVANYRFETPDIGYLVRMIVKYGNGHEKPLNITIHGKTQIAIEGMKMHVLDDEGKDVKLDIVEKTAKTPSQ
jgi:hypothetical protein